MSAAHPYPHSGARAHHSASSEASRDLRGHRTQAASARPPPVPSPLCAPSACLRPGECFSSPPYLHHRARSSACASLTASQHRPPFPAAISRGPEARVHSPPCSPPRRTRGSRVSIVPSFSYALIALHALPCVARTGGVRALIRWKLRLSVLASFVPAASIT